MVKIAATLAKYTPKAYQCPMRCEGEKTYDKPRKCPKCGMDLQDVKSHVEHGGH
jgi:transcription initiation factor IIE alpha subunit